MFTSFKTREEPNLRAIGSPFYSAPLSRTAKKPLTPQQLKDQNLEISAAPQSPVTSFFKKYTPEAIQEGVSLLKEGLVGKGQGVDLAGKETNDTGLIGMLRPFGLGKTDIQRFTERMDKLTGVGVDPTRAGDIASQYTRGDNSLQFAANQRKAIRDTVLTPAETKALKAVSFWEGLDTAFGGLDVLSLGTTSFGKSIITQIAKSSSVDEIGRILVREIPELAGDVTAHKGLSTLLSGVNSEQTVETVLNRVKFGYQGVKGAETAVSRSLIEPQKFQGVESLVKNAESDLKQNAQKKILELQDEIKVLQSRGIGTASEEKQIAGLNKLYPQSKSVSQIDQLIADNKVRVVSRDGRDVYQVKKGKEWANVRDEDSAIKQATTEPISKAVQLPQRLEEKKMQLELAQEALDNNSAKQLSKYVSTRGDFKGGLKEVTGKDTSVFGTKGDDIVTELGFDDSEQARKAYDEYVQQKEDVGLLKAEVRKEEKDFRASSKEVSSETPKTTPTKPLSKAEASSLEKTAQESLNTLPEPTRREVSSLPKIIIDTSTSVKKKVTWLDYFRTPDRVLNKIGLNEAANALRIGYDNYLKELPVQLEVITQWSKQVSKEGNKKIFQYLDGQEITLNADEQRVAGEIKMYLKEWADRLNLPEDDQVSHYITHIFEIGAMEKEFDEDVAKIIADKVPGSVYDPFLEKRLGAKNYIQDTWRALDAYVKRGVRKANMDPALEILERDSSHLEKSQADYAMRLGQRVNMQPMEWDTLLDNHIKQLIGYRAGQRPTAVITGTLRKMVYRGALGLNITSAVKNLTQGVNTFAKLGTRDTITGYLTLMKPGMGKELEEVGVLRDTFIQDRTLSAVKQTLQKVDKGLFFMFQVAEKVNRGSAYFGAKAKALRVGKSEAEAIKYAKKMVADTQFLFGSIDTPVAMQGDIPKTLLQFGSFTQKQTEFLIEMAKNKEYAGIVRYILASLGIVYTVGQVFNIKGSDFNPFGQIVRLTSRFGQPPALALPIEIFKSIFNVPDQYGKVPSTKTKIKNILNATKTLIPAGVQLDKIFKGNTLGTSKKKETVTGGNFSGFK